MTVNLTPIIITAIICFTLVTITIFGGHKK